MSELIYIDTNVFMDYFDNITDYLRPLGEFVFRLLQKSAECKFNIIISSLILEELFYNSYENKIKELLPGFNAKGKIIQAEITKTDVELARKICNERKTHFNDTLHAIIAQRMNAKYLVTRNVKDFINIPDIIKVVLPEYL